MAKDLFHQAVRNALEKENWSITDDPLSLKLGGVDLYIDLGAEKLLAAERAGQKIAVEIKTFGGRSEIAEFHLALGQFLNYRLALQVSDPARELFLAVPQVIYESFFTLEFIKMSITNYQIKLLVYEPATETIALWKN
ncbi:XisH family protein [Limnothrix sp. FACHB-881]|uniref:XisH family protein n=1 Tax=Limnothrix sp. FACHB-881 TaxID=2692819 RepID=UPI00168625A3|nr:XisH family protein [Limnothrix sp. FACHB-881]MBD2633732.1 XisH family protein [Limnothrix sp. FACHB-881]